MVKSLDPVWETQAQSLGPEDPLEKGMATHSSIFAWKIPWTEEPGGLQSLGSQRVKHNTHTHTHTHTHTQHFESCWHIGISPHYLFIIIFI